MILIFTFLNVFQYQNLTTNLKEKADFCPKPLVYYIISFAKNINAKRLLLRGRLVHSHFLHISCDSSHSVCSLSFSAAYSGAAFISSPWWFMLFSIFPFSVSALHLNYCRFAPPQETDFFMYIYIKPFFSICECKKCGRLDLPYCVLVLQWHERIIKTLRNVILIQAENETADLSVLLCNSLAIKPILGKMTSKAILKLIGWWSAWEDIFS